MIKVPSRFAVLLAVAAIGWAGSARADDSNRLKGLSQALNTPVGELLNSPVISTNPASAVLTQIETTVPGTPGFGPGVAAVASQNGQAASEAAHQLGASSAISGQGFTRSNGVGGGHRK